MPAAAPPTVLHLFLIVGRTLRDRNGGRLGEVDDLIVRLGEDYLPVTGVLATVAGRQVFVPAGELMGEHRNGPVFNVLAGLTVLATSVLSITLLGVTIGSAFL